MTWKFVLSYAELLERIAAARDAGDINREHPWIMVEAENDGRRYDAVLCVCEDCLTEPVFEGDRRCGPCSVERRWKEMCPPRYRKYASLDQIGKGPRPWTDDEIATIREFLDSETAKTLGLISAPGRGKTTAGFALLRAIIDADPYVFLCRGPLFVYTTATEMLHDLTVRQFEPDAHDRYTEPDILFLDEIGDRDNGLTDFQRQQLQLVLEKRYREEKTLIWTSNLPLKDLRNWCAERTWERLWDEAIVQQIGGQTRRRLAA